MTDETKSLVVEGCADYNRCLDPVWVKTNKHLLGTTKTLTTYSFGNNLT